MGFSLSELEVTSPAFAAGGTIPIRHTGEDLNISPPLAWARPPQGTKGYAVICHDPDAPLVTPAGSYGYVHWVLYGIPGSVASLAEGTREFTPGKNENGELGYTGPMPPKGHGRHHYFFWVLALGQPLDLPPGLDLRGLLAAVEPHTLGMNRLLGTYERR